MGSKCVDAADRAPAEEAPALLQHCAPGVPVAVDDGGLVHVVGQQLLARLDAASNIQSNHELSSLLRVYLVRARTCFLRVSP